MELLPLYELVNKAVSKLDFSRVWPGFAPLRFALYDRERCVFDGRYVEKTDVFCANTSIEYQGEQIAIWMVQGETELSVLCSKIVHEMFHGFQTLQGWDCWPNEMEALQSYVYDAENLSLKLRENRLLLRLLDCFDDAICRELLSIRKLRGEQFPDAFAYECRVEEIEGSASYVEWQVLKQLDAEKALALTERMRAGMTRPEALLPIRISCYDSGALLIHALSRAGLYRFDASARPVLRSLLQDVSAADGDFPGREDAVRGVSNALKAYNDETQTAIQTALARGEIVLEGPLELLCVNLYDARRRNDYLRSSGFLLYRDGEGEKLLPGDFVIKLRDKNEIERVYRWK